METIMDFGVTYKAAKVSKYMQSLADEYGLGVCAYIDSNVDGYGTKRKVYKFTGGPLSSFEDLSRVVKGYQPDNTRNGGFVGARYLISDR